MCLLNYNQKNEKYKHFSYAERTMIETWYNKDGKAKKEIANLLHKSERTIRREINRGCLEGFLHCENVLQINGKCATMLVFENFLKMVLY